MTATDEKRGLFALREYDRAFAHAFHDAVHELARASDPLLSQMRVETREHITTSRVTTDERDVVDLPPMTAQIEVAFKNAHVIEGNINALVVAIDEAAQSHLRSVMPQIFESISKITDATGNTVDAGGRPFSPELLLEALEKIEWSFDEHGEPIMPTLVMHPDMAKKVADLPPLTPEQEQAFEDLKERKRAEYRASRRHRKLS